MTDPTEWSPGTRDGIAMNMVGTVLSVVGVGLFTALCAAWAICGCRPSWPANHRPPWSRT